MFFKGGKINKNILHYYIRRKKCELVEGKCNNMQNIYDVNKLYRRNIMLKSNSKEKVVCSRCDKDITFEYSEIFKGEKYCLSCIKKVKQRSNGETENSIGQILQTIGVIAMVGGIALGLWVYYETDELLAGIPYLISGIISGMMFLGFGEIINLLNKIYKRLEKNN